jgi:hypothetical protein
MFDALAGLDDETAVVISTEKHVIAAGAPQRSPAGCPAHEGRWGDDGVDDDDDGAMEEEDPFVAANLDELRLAEREKLLTANRALLHKICLAHTRRSKKPETRAVRLANHYLTKSVVSPTDHICLFAGDMSRDARSRFQTSEALQSLLEPFEGITMHDVVWPKTT